MTDEPQSEQGTETGSVSRDRSPTAATTSTYKVLGEFADAGGAGVLGRNTAGSGTPVGVAGVVPNAADGYGLSTPDDALIGGVLDTDETDFALEAGTTATSDARNVVLGHASNSVNPTATAATVGGGGYDDGSLTEPNEVLDNYGTVGGGRNNVAGDDDFNDDPTTAEYATVAGGEANTANGGWSSLGGGFGNTAKGPSSTVAGGDSNFAKTYATAVGGGFGNEATAKQATVGGGYKNVANGGQSTIGGGSSNETKDSFATVGGGSGNIASGPLSTVGGGSLNSAIQYATVGGGEENDASGSYSTVGGGKDNLADATESTVGGGDDNDASSIAATVGGGSDNSAAGQYATISGGTSNAVTGFRATVGGGKANTVEADDATVAGGSFNLVHDRYATIGGGRNNVAGDFTTGTSGATYATVPGGRGNAATGAYSFAAGRNADADDKDGAFVWGDATSTTVTAAASNSVTLQAGGTASSGTAVEIYSQSDGSAGVVLDRNAGSWGSLSSAAAKTDVEPVDGRTVLDRLTDLDVSTWRYDGQSEDVRHMGPMAEEFNRTFGLGTADDRITNVDADGVALAAIQGLAERGDRRERRLRRHDDRVASLAAENDALRERNEALAERVAALEERVAAIESGAASAEQADD